MQWWSPPGSRVQAAQAESTSCRRPPQVACSEGCGLVYCSAACQQAAWQQHHCLLCPGPARAGAGSSSSQDPGGGSAGTASSSPQAESAGPGADGGEVVQGMPVHRAHLAAFQAHAHATNDIFKLAAQVRGRHAHGCKPGPVTYHHFSNPAMLLCVAGGGTGGSDSRGAHSGHCRQHRPRPERCTASAAVA
jgi:hypothetical protein